MTLSRHTPIAPEAAAHFLLRRDVAFLNHGSFGACPAPVFETYQRGQRTLEAEPVEFLGRRIDALLAEARAPLAAYLGAEPANLVFVPNATHGINIVARSIAPGLEPGDEVLLTDHEYGAVERTWRFLCERAGATLRIQPIPLPLTDTADVIDHLWRGVTDRTQVLVVSHITSPTALTFPVAAICARAAEEGILTVIDGAHAPGQLDLALDTIGADFYAGNLHKWVCAPKGAGFLYARPERQSLLQPLIVSWGWQPREPSPSPFQDLFGWTGTADPSAYLSVPAAIQFQQQHDWPAVRAAAHTLAAETRARIAELTGLPPICPDTPDWFVQMCACPLPIPDDLPAKALQTRLFDEHRIEVPLVEWEGKHPKTEGRCVAPPSRSEEGRRFVRVSLQAYNGPADIDRLLAALAEIL
jgi:isopenicillin-N epimerase